MVGSLITILIVEDSTNWDLADLKHKPQYLIATPENSLNKIVTYQTANCMKGVRIRSFSGLFFPAFRLNMKIYVVSLRIQSTFVKIGTKKHQIWAFFTQCQEAS